MPAPQRTSSFHLAVVIDYPDLVSQFMLVRRLANQQDNFSNALRDLQGLGVPLECRSKWAFLLFYDDDLQSNAKPVFDGEWLFFRRDYLASPRLVRGVSLQGTHSGAHGINPDHVNWLHDDYAPTPRPDGPTDSLLAPDSNASCPPPAPSATSPTSPTAAPRDLAKPPHAAPSILPDPDKFPDTPPRDMPEAVIDSETRVPVPTLQPTTAPSPATARSAALHLDASPSRSPPTQPIDAHSRDPDPVDDSPPQPETARPDFQARHQLAQDAPPTSCRLRLALPRPTAIH